MIKKVIAPVLTVLVLAGAGSAYAASDRGDASEMRYKEFTKCEDLASKFDQSVDKHQDAKNLARAKQLRSDGMMACSRDNYMQGIHSLQQALLDIGVTPPSVDYY